MRGGKNIFKSSPIEFYIIGPWKRISNFQPLQPLQRALLNLSVGIPGIRLILRGQEKPERQNNRRFDRWQLRNCRPLSH